MDMDGALGTQTCNLQSQIGAGDFKELGKAWLVSGDSLKYQPASSSYLLGESPPIRKLVQEAPISSDITQPKWKRTCLKPHCSN